MTSRRSQNDPRKEQPPPLRVRVFVPFLQPTQTIILVLERDWTGQVIVSALMEHFRKNGTLLGSYQPYDYTVRFEGPGDGVVVPKQAEAIEFPGMVLEKSPELLEREARLMAERQALLRRGWEELAERERVEADADRLAGEVRTERERQAQREAEARRQKEELLARRAANVWRIEMRRKVEDDRRMARCADMERRRVKAIHDYRTRFLPRQYHAREAAPQRPVTTLDVLVGRLHQSILQAQEMEAGVEQQAARLAFESAAPQRERTSLARQRGLRFAEEQELEVQAAAEAETAAAERKEREFQARCARLHDTPHSPLQPVPGCLPCIVRDRT
eukprot:EG_transcript_13958